EQRRPGQLTAHRHDDRLHLGPGDGIQLQDGFRIHSPAVDQDSQIVVEDRHPQKVVKSNTAGRALQDELLVVLKVELEDDILHRIKVLRGVGDLHNPQQHVDVLWLHLFHASPHLGSLGPVRTDWKGKRPGANLHSLYLKTFHLGSLSAAARESNSPYSIPA